MSSHVFIFLLLFTAVLLELIFGSYGLFVPATGLAVYYMAVTYDWGAGVFSAVCCGILLDSVYGRDFYYSPFCLLAVVGLAMLWLYWIEGRSIALLAIPGAFLGVLCAGMPILVFLKRGFALGSFMDSAAQLLFAAGLAAVALPATVVLLDGFAEPLGFELFAKAKDKIPERR